MAPSSPVLASDTSTAVAIRSATDTDWPAISLLDATSFGRFGHPESLTAWRSLMSIDSTVLACDRDGGDVVGMAHYLAMRLTVDNMLRHTASKGSPGLESLKWLKPVYPGDRLSLRHTILESRPLKSRPDTGLVRSRWEMFNQHGDKVLEMEGYGMFGRREPAAG